MPAYLQLLGATVVGWFLSELSQFVRGRSAERQAIARVLTELLEVRHRAYAVRSAIQCLRKYPQVNAHEAIALILGPTSPLHIESTYDKELLELSAYRPVFAFQLRMQNVIPQMVAMIRGIAQTEATTSDQEIALHQIESVLEPAFLQLLDDNVKDLAAAHGVRTRLQLRRYNKALSDFPAAAEQMLQQLVAAANQPSPNRPK